MVSVCGKVFVFFFFSSRRRHTRWTGDWSSDVCSSDLFEGEGVVEGDGGRHDAILPRAGRGGKRAGLDRKSTRLNSSHPSISYAVFCLQKKKKKKKKK